MVLAVGGGRLEHHLVLVRHGLVAGMVAAEDRGLAGTHGPPASGRIAAALHQGLHHRPVHRLHGRTRDCALDADGEDAVAERARLSHVRELFLALDQAEQADEVGGVDELAETLERRVDHLRALPCEAVGVVLDAEAFPPAPVVLEHCPQVLARRGALAVVPDADVLDNGGLARLDAIRGARQQRERPVRPRYIPWNMVYPLVS